MELRQPASKLCSHGKEFPAGFVSPLLAFYRRREKTNPEEGKVVTVNICIYVRVYIYIWLKQVKSCGFACSKLLVSQERHSRAGFTLYTSRGAAFAAMGITTLEMHIEQQ